jgi:hypothetical protein
MANVFCTNSIVMGTGVERFSWGLDVLINGILSTPRNGQDPSRASQQRTN